MALKYRHPVTGEAIGFGQHLSWTIQKAIRRWYFIGVITAITLTCVVWGTFNFGIIGWWNVWASYMALFIESVVGIAMYEQTRADAKIIRESLQIIRAVLSMEKDQFQEVKDLMEFIESEMLKHHAEEFRHRQNEESQKNTVSDNVKKTEGQDS